MQEQALRMAVTWLLLARLSDMDASHSAIHLHRTLHALMALPLSMLPGSAHGPGESQTEVSCPASKCVLSRTTNGLPETTYF